MCIYVCGSDYMPFSFLDTKQKKEKFKNKNKKKIIM